MKRPILPCDAMLAQCMLWSYVCPHTGIVSKSLNKQSQK